MDEYESLSHTTWDCKYHVVFIPKCRRKTLYQELRRHLGEVFRRLALQKESKVEEGHLMPDHVHMLLSIPPKYAVSQVVRVGLSRARARSTWLGFMESANAISSDSTSGPEVSSSTRSGATRKPSAPTFATKRKRIRGLNWTPFVGPRGVEFKVLSGLPLSLKNQAASCCFCLCCGYVGNAFALSKRSGISTALAAASILSMPARHTAIGIWLFIAW